MNNFFVPNTEYKIRSVVRFMLEELGRNYEPLVDENLDTVMVAGITVYLSDYQGADADEAFAWTKAMAEAHGQEWLYGSFCVAMFPFYMPEYNQGLVN